MNLHTLSTGFLIKRFQGDISRQILVCISDLMFSVSKIQATEKEHPVNGQHYISLTRGQCLGREKSARIIDAFDNYQLLTDLDVHRNQKTVIDTKSISFDTLTKICLDSVSRKIVIREGDKLFSCYEAYATKRDIDNNQYLVLMVNNPLRHEEIPEIVDSLN